MLHRAVVPLPPDRISAIVAVLDSFKRWLTGQLVEQQPCNTVQIFGHFKNSTASQSTKEMNRGGSMHLVRLSHPYSFPCFLQARKVEIESAKRKDKPSLLNL
jgi:hypothetical protein